MLGKLSAAFATKEKYPDEKEIDKFIRENVFSDRSIRAPMEAQGREIRKEYPGIQIKQLQDSFMRIWRFIVRNEIKTLQSQHAVVDSNSDQPQLESPRQSESEQISNQMPPVLKILVTQIPNVTPPPPNGSGQTQNRLPPIPQLRLAPIPDAATAQPQNASQHNPDRIPGIAQIFHSEDLSPIQLPQVRLAPIQKPALLPQSPQRGPHLDPNVPSQQVRNASPNWSDQSSNRSPQLRTPSRSQRTPSVPSQLGIQMESVADLRKRALIDAEDDGTRPPKRRGGTYMDPAIQKTLEYWISGGIVELDDLEDWIDDKRQVTLSRSR